MDQLDKAIAEHIAKLRELAKEAEDFSSRLSANASILEDHYRYLKEKMNATSHVQAG